MTRPNLKLRTFLLALVPMLLITVILSLYFINVQLKDIDETINNRGTSMAMHLANASEYSMFSGNKDDLNTLLRSSITEEDILSISLFDKSGNLFVSMSNNSEPTTRLSSKSINSRVFRHPITLHTTDVFDIHDIDNAKKESSHDEILGWLEISLSTFQMVEKRNQAIMDASFIILIGLISSIILALWMGKSLTDPILRLTRSVHRVEEGHLDEEIMTISSGEIGYLEKGFLSMLRKIRVTQKDLQDRIDETTQGLKSSLAVVEKQNLELTEARIRALESSQAKSRFLANISHELRTPMNGILGFARLLKDTRLNGKQKDYVVTIEKSANNLLLLIEDILDISRVEAGKLKIKNKVFDLHDCVNEAITLLSPSIHEKNLDISFHYYSDTPRTINAPYERIRQVLINLLGNAIKFSNKGTITIRVMLDPDESKHDSILISVADEGIGIPENEIDKLFEPFTQIDDTSTRIHGGTGLGLAISKSIIKAMGGEIGIESVAGKGTKSWFTFYHHPEEIEEQKQPSEPPQNNIVLNNVKILIAEDNPINTKLLSSILSESGAEINHVTNGEEAVSAFQNDTYDLILMDIQMPIMSGYDATLAIRNKTRQGNDIPIIGITANAMQNDIELYKNEGFNDILIKPIVPEELIQTINMWIQKTKNNNYTDDQTTTSTNKSLENNTESKADNANKLGIKKELSSMLLEMLINELPEVSLQLQDAYTTQNWKSIRQQIHKLLGGISYCDVPNLQKFTLKFQESLKSRKDTLESDFNDLIDEIERLTSSKSVSS